ncbi:amidohydrolase family protein [Cohnella thailandensis]|uniref:Amidohydrolase family protein n=1 Tax=Cohnella thailandensis TaxID=557557 RepID=A0A841T298_9BACL|nr:amidohydrolase family protein [Cohnella thailandensis]MBB6636498.1 amidohydrolase family protein [Cohnella thailandensis]MBP1977630.1 cytosine deaminase [Cohnella thailandensis]
MKEWMTRGFSNEHAHLDKGMLYTFLPYKDEPVPIRAEWTRQAKAAFTKQDIYDRAEKALQTMLAYGTRYVRTHVDVDPLVGLKGVEALLELKERYEDRIVIDLTAFAQEGFDRFPQSEALLLEALRMGKMGVGGHTLADGDGEAHIDRVLSIAEAGGAEWAEFHTDESGRPEHFLLPYLATAAEKRGWGGRCYAIHCNSLANVTEKEAEEAIELVSRSGLHVTVCPTAIATRALAPVKKLRKAGVRVGLGSDNIGDFFNPYGSGNMLHYAQLLAYVQRFYEPEESEYLVGLLLQEPAHAESAAKTDKLEIRYRYDNGTARELIAHAKAPRAFTPLREGALGYE